MKSELRSAIAQWILVRAFGYVTSLLTRLQPAPDEKDQHPQHVELLRGVCAVLYRQIRDVSSPIYEIKPSNNEWP